MSAPSLPPKPERGPDPAAMRVADEFAAYAAESVTRTRDSAEKWRTGMAALVTLVTTALLLKGPEKAADLATGWRLALTVLLGAGLGLAIAALWQALTAAAGVPGPVDVERVVARHGDLTSFRVAEAARAARRLRRARLLLVPALVLLGTGTFAWWWAPPPDPQPRIAVRYDAPGDGHETSLCGRLSSSDGQVLAVTPEAHSRPTRIPFSRIVDFRAVTTCP
jgi:hypothetical protein